MNNFGNVGDFENTHCGLGDSIGGEIGGEYFLGNEIFNFSDGDFTDSCSDLALVHSGLKMKKKVH